MSLTDIGAAFRWWLVLMIVGAIAFPLAHYLFRHLTDRGYAFTKVVGVLVISFAFWLFGSLGFLNNNLGGIFFGITILAVLSSWIYLRRRKSGAPDNALLWIKENWRYAAAVELVFALIFITWTWVRTQNPAISGTEKPMEFAFLNSMGRSEYFPPLDPWLSGFSISYYYFGYVMISVIGRLAAVQEPTGFNLAIAWLMAASALGALGLVFNLISSGSERIQRTAFLFGVAAAIALPLAGNMEILFEILHANGIGSDSFWEWLDVRDLEAPAGDVDTPRYETGQWWWWRSSRVIHEYHLSGRAEEGLEPIAEVPSFSFVLGDLHAHVLALPYAFLSLGIALSWWLRKDQLRLNYRDWISGTGPVMQIRSLLSNDKALILFTALVLGGLSFLNTWDVIIHLFIILSAFFLSQWRILGRWRPEATRQTVTLGFILVVSAILLYLPFFIGFRSQAGPPFLLPMLMRPTRLTHFLIIFLMPLIGVCIFLANLVLDNVRRNNRTRNIRLVWQSALATIGLIVFLLALMLLLGIVVAASDEGSVRVASLADELNLSLPDRPVSSAIGERLSWSVPAVFRIVPPFLNSRINAPFLILFLSLILAAVFFLLASISRRFSPSETDQRGESATALPFAILLIGTAVLLSLGPEFVYLRDNFGQRINTVFKFYYQAWVLFGVSALYGIAYLLKRHRISGWIAGVAYAAAFVIGLMFPYYAVQSRAIEYRGPEAADERAEATLDGLAHLARSDPSDFEAIEWFRNNVDGSPVVVEAVGGQYTGFGRISASTGLPTLLGWAGHEYQWRGSTPEPAIREPAVRTIYETGDIRLIENILDQYQVSYIVYGPIERSTYNPGGEEKFSNNLEVAFENGSVTVYRWQPR